MADTPGGKLTIRETVKGGWASRPTLYRAIKDGRLSVDKSVAGRTLIDVAELVRVFGEPRNRDSKPVADHAAARLAEMAAEIERLKAATAAAETEARRLAQANAEAVERERWLRGQLDRHTTLLASYGPQKGFWGRLFGTNTAKGGQEGDK